MEILSKGGFIFVTTISVYVSSLSTSGVKAMVLTLPAIVGLLAFFDLVASIAYRSRDNIMLGFANNRMLVAAFVTGFIAVALRFAYVNHRSTERRGGRIFRQRFLRLPSQLGYWQYG